MIFYKCFAIEALICNAFQLNYNSIYLSGTEKFSLDSDDTSSQIKLSKWRVSFTPCFNFLDKSNDADRDQVFVFQIEKTYLSDILLSDR